MIKTSNKSNKKWNLKNDVYFKEFFSRKENEKFLNYFLSCLLKKDIHSLEVKKDFTLRKEKIKLKTGILDIQAKLEDGSIVILEMQIRNYYNMPERMTYYCAKSIAMQLKSGEDYSKLKPVTIIVILDYPLYQCNRYLSTSTITQEDQIVMVDKMNFKVIELPKIRKQKPDYQDDVYCWLMFIDGRNKEVINMIKETKPIFEEAEEELEKLYDESELEAIAESRQKWEWDMYSLKQHIREESLKKGIQQGIKQGKKQGKKEGAQTEKIKTIQAMLKHGFDSKTISTIMQISTKEIEKISTSTLVKK